MFFHITKWISYKDLQIHQFSIFEYQDNNKNYQMSNLECCQCGCKNSSQWVCIECNNKCISPRQQLFNMKELRQISSIKKPHLQSTSQKQSPFQQSVPNILCREHEQPLTFYHPVKRQLFCALCLFDSSISRTVIKPQGLVPLKSSTDLVAKEFKQTMEQIGALSRSLDEDLRKSIQYQRLIQRQKKYIESSITKIKDQMIKTIQQREEQLLLEVDNKLKQQFQIYNLHQNHLAELKNNIKELRSLGNKKNNQLKIQELTYLFEAAKSIKRSLQGNTFKVQPFKVDQYNLRMLEDQKKQFQRLVEVSFSWGNKKTDGKQKSQRKRERTQISKKQSFGYLQRSRKVFR